MHIVERQIIIKHFSPGSCFFGVLIPRHKKERVSLSDCESLEMALCCEWRGNPSRIFWFVKNLLVESWFLSSTLCVVKIRAEHQHTMWRLGSLFLWCSERKHLLWKWLSARGNRSRLNVCFWLALRVNGFWEMKHDCRMHLEENQKIRVNSKYSSSELSSQELRKKTQELAKAITIHSKTIES